MQMEVDEEVPASGDIQGAKKEEKEKASKSKSSKAPAGPMFTLKKWNAVAMWQWDVECDTCAICRVQVMGELCIPPLHHIKSCLENYSSRKFYDIDDDSVL